MRLFLRFLRSRVALASVGMVLIGGVSGTLAAVGPSLGAHPAGSQTLAPTDLAAAGATTATATPRDPTASTGDGAQAQPTATPQSQSQPFGLHGVIVRTDTASGSLVLQTSDGVTQQIVVNASTRYSGAARGLRGVRAGMVAEIQGRVFADGTYLATQVDTQPLAAAPTAAPGSGPTPTPVPDN
jgi:hypothetical protein